MVGNTLFVGRKVKKAKVASAANSFGRNFEDFFTTEDPEFEDTEGHHRVLKYDFGGLIMVIRVEEDAFIPNTEYAYGTPVILHPEYVPEDAPDACVVHTGSEATRVIMKGTLIPHTSMIELNSNTDSIPKEQMWFGRTFHCALGQMEKEKPDTDNGEAPEDQIQKLEASQGDNAEESIPQRKIKRLDVKIMDEQAIEKWEMENQEKLQKLVWLLQKLRETVMDEAHGSAIMVSLGKGKPLTVYGTKEKVGALPQEIIDTFWSK